MNNRKAWLVSVLSVLAIALLARQAVLFYYRAPSDVHSDATYSGRTKNAEWEVVISQDEVVVDVAGRGTSIRLESLNGGETDFWTRFENPGMGKYFVSLRVIDRDGIPWIMAIADAPPSWMKDYENTIDGNVDDKERAASYALFVDAITALESLPPMNFHALDELKQLVRWQIAENAIPAAE